MRFGTTSTVDAYLFTVAIAGRSTSHLGATKDVRSGLATNASVAINLDLSTRFNHHSDTSSSLNAATLEISGVIASALLTEPSFGAINLLAGRNNINIRIISLGVAIRFSTESNTAKSTSRATNSSARVLHRGNTRAIRTFGIVSVDARSIFRAIELLASNSGVAHLSTFNTDHGGGIVKVNTAAHLGLARNILDEELFDLALTNWGAISTSTGFLLLDTLPDGLAGVGDGKNNTFSIAAFTTAESTDGARIDGLDRLDRLGADHAESVSSGVNVASVTNFAASFFAAQEGEIGAWAGGLVSAHVVARNSVTKLPTFATLLATLRLLVLAHHRIVAFALLIRGDNETSRKGTSTLEVDSTTFTIHGANRVVIIATFDAFNTDGVERSGSEFAARISEGLLALRVFRASVGRSFTALGFANLHITFPGATIAWLAAVFTTRETNGGISARTLNNRLAHAGLSVASRSVTRAANRIGVRDNSICVGPNSIA